MKNFNTPIQKQSGAALIMVLMLLIIITLLGLASMRGALMQEKMAASTAGRAMAFQAAESGLRQAEMMVRDGAVTLPATPTCSAGLCGNPGAATPVWQASGFWTDGGTGYKLGTVVASGAGAIAPKFVIEAYGTATNNSASSQCIDKSKPCMSSTRQNIYRMTSYALAPSGAEVILQSMYKR